jgi:hypothetical protein
MFARIVECIPSLEKKEEFLKKLRLATRTRQVAAGNGMIHEVAMLKWARGLAFILSAVLIVLVISVAGK